MQAEHALQAAASTSPDRQPVAALPESWSPALRFQVLLALQVRQFDRVVLIHTSCFCPHCFTSLVIVALSAGHAAFRSRHSKDELELRG